MQESDELVRRLIRRPVLESPSHQTKFQRDHPR